MLHQKSLGLNVNLDCNLRCKWCYAQGASYAAGKNMDLGFAKKIAIILKEMQVKKIILLVVSQLSGSHSSTSITSAAILG